MEHALDREALCAALRRRRRRIGPDHVVGSALSLGATVDAALPFGDGLPCAALHGFASEDRDRGLSFALAVAARSAGLVAWIAASHPGPSPSGSSPWQSRCGLAASRLLLVRAEAEEDVTWAAEEALRSGAASAVVVETDRWSPDALGRLDLAAGTGGGVGLCLLTTEAEVPRFPALSTQWRVNDGSGARRSGSRLADPWWEVELLTSRGLSRHFNVTWRMAAEVMVAKELTGAGQEEAFAD